MSITSSLWALEPSAMGGLPLPGATARPFRLASHATPIRRSLQPLLIAITSTGAMDASQPTTGRSVPCWPIRRIIWTRRSTRCSIKAADCALQPAEPLLQAHLGPILAPGLAQHTTHLADGRQARQG